MAKTPKCFICNDSGFANGKICKCVIDGGKCDLPDEFKDIFGDMFSTTPEAKKEKSGGNPEREY
jgi:hypothetical protein